MKDFDIFTDSAANIPDEFIAKHDIKVLSYYCTVNGVEQACYEDGKPFPMTAKAFYDNMRAGADIKTSCISSERMLEAFEPCMKKGRDVIFISISSGISGTYSMALEAKSELEKKYPDNKLYVCDSANASMGEGLQVLKVADLRDMGESAETCAKWIQTNAYKINSYLTVSDLKYLKKGGRISTTLAIAGTLLNIKPVLKADASQNAKIVAFSNQRGRKKSILALADAFSKYVENPSNQKIAICHADCLDDAQMLADVLKERGATDIIIEYYDMCTGSHVGPGTIALFFFGKDRRLSAEAAEKSVQGKTAKQKV